MIWRQEPQRHIRGHLGGLQKVLTIDGTGVTVLGAWAAMTALRRPSVPRALAGLSATAAVGVAGWLLAATAVGSVSGNDSLSDDDGATMHAAVQLVSTGFVVNTAGCAAILQRFRHDRDPAAAAAALLLGGAILSILYHRHLVALRRPSSNHGTAR